MTAAIGWWALQRTPRCPCGLRLPFGHDLAHLGVLHTTSGCTSTTAVRLRGLLDRIDAALADAGVLAVMPDDALAALDHLDDLATDLAAEHTGGAA